MIPDYELLKAYAEAYDREHFGRMIAGLRAVAAYAAAKQRDMEPTEAMLESAGPMDGWDGAEGMADRNHIDWFIAMQRAAPLVTEGGNG